MGIISSQQVGLQESIITDFKTKEGFSAGKIELIAGYFPRLPAIIYIPDN